MNHLNTDKGLRMREKKMIGKSVAVGLGIVSIVLAAGLVGVLAYYMPIATEKDSIIASKDSRIASLNSNNTSLQDQVNDLNSNVTSLQNQVNNLNSSLRSFQDQLNNLTDILNLQKSEVWVDRETVNIGSTTVGKSAPYAGYVTVEASSQYNVSVKVSYMSLGVSYENTTIFGNNGTAVFPVLPSNISFLIFQTMSKDFVLSGPLYATVTITYYY